MVTGLFLANKKYVLLFNLGIHIWKANRNWLGLSIFLVAFLYICFRLSSFFFFGGGGERSCFLIEIYVFALKFVSALFIHDVYFTTRT